MDLGELKIDGFNITVFGTPGLLRFSVMRDVVADGADGLIYIFDAADPEKDKAAIKILNSIRKLLKPNTPIVYLANKQDLPDARSPEVVKAQNSLAENSKVFPTSTKTGLNIQESLKYLVNEIFEKYKELIQLLRKYETNIRGLADVLKKNKAEMRDLLNNLEIKRIIKIDRIKKVYKVSEGLRNIT